jgi:hypothetical protein
MIVLQCIPFSPCWCSTHVGHPKCKTVNTPINEGLIFLLLAGLIFGIYLIKKLKNNYKTTTNQKQ